MNDIKNIISRKRNYYPGDKWLFFKIYCGAGTIDEILCNSISRVILEFRRKSHVRRWFFIRYSDPDFHLRLRFELNDSQHIEDVINLLYRELSTYIHSGQIYRIAIDTYCREIERYGGWGLMDLSETLFYHDSELVLKVLQRLKANTKLDERWKFAFIIVDNLLHKIHFSTEEKLKMAKSLSNSYMHEFNLKSSNTKISAIYRKNKNIIEQLLGDCGVYLKRLKLSKAFAEWEQSIESCLSTPKIRKDIRITSIIHMCLNRLFATSNRLNEMMIYNFLSRYYSSIIAREKSKK